MRFLRTVIQDVFATTFRSTLTCLSMLVGVLGVVGVAAAGAITEEFLIASSEQTAGRVATFTTDLPLTNGLNTALDVYQDLQQRIGPQSAGLAITLDQASHLTPHDTASHPTLISWFEGDLNSVRRLPVVAGAIPNTTSAYPPWIALNQAAAQETSLEIGDRVQIRTSEDSPAVDFTVVAIIADGSTDETQAYAPLRQATLWHDNLIDATAELLLTVPATAQPELINAVTASFTHLNVKTEPLQRTDGADTIAQNVQLVQTVFLGCGAVALTVAALGILNIGLASVSERSHELVIRRAIGARRRDIFAQILGTALFLGALASITAIAITATAIYLIVPTQIPPETAIQNPTFPWTACAWGILAAATTAVIGAAAPALKASRLPIAQALRT